MWIIFLGIGIFIGFAASKSTKKMTTATGYFKLAPYDEDNTGFYKVNIRIDPDQDLLTKHYILLEKETHE